jgi:hypothetical protein
MLLETMKENFSLYWLPSLRMNIVFLESVVNGIGKIRSGLPWHKMVRLTIFTSGSIFSTFQQNGFYINMFKKMRILNSSTVSSDKFQPLDQGTTRIYRTKFGWTCFYIGKLKLSTSNSRHINIS